MTGSSNVVLIDKSAMPYLSKINALIKPILADLVSPVFVQIGPSNYPDNPPLKEIRAFEVAKITHTLGDTISVFVTESGLWFLLRCCAIEPPKYYSLYRAEHSTVAFDQMFRGRDRNDFGDNYNYEKPDSESAILLKIAFADLLAQCLNGINAVISMHQTKLEALRARRDWMGVVFIQALS